MTRSQETLRRLAMIDESFVEGKAGLRCPLNSIPMRSAHRALTAKLRLPPMFGGGPDLPKLGAAAAPHLGIALGMDIAAALRSWAATSGLGRFTPTG